MRSIMSLDSQDLTALACPWCGRTPPPAVFGLKTVREGEVVGMIAAAPASALNGPYLEGSTVIVQAWVRRPEVGEQIGTQLMHRLAATQTHRGVRALIAPGTYGVPNCQHLPAAFLDGLGFLETVPGAQWRMDLRSTIRVPDAVQAVADAVSRILRPGRPAAANRSRWNNG
ncbi:MAG: hypothetical protein QM708_08500 [Propioniciclava sp.]|uniref:hypothetical protein n=1 Tax=Propioniciclava sp. TaxID=2038686 RepID=UPI0039E6DE76